MAVPEAVVDAVERALRHQFAYSLPHDDDDAGWRREAEIVAQAAIDAYRQTETA